MKRLADGLLVLAGVLGIAVGAWVLQGWGGAKVDEVALAGTKLPAGFAPLAIAIAGWVLSFFGRRSARPWALAGAGLFLAGAGLGVPLREAATLYDMNPFNPSEKVPVFDGLAAALVLGCGLVPAALAAAFELANRALWPALAQHFDAKEWAHAALVANRVSLVFRPGQAGVLRSVTLSLFREGQRGEVVETLRQLHAADPKDEDVLEALCKASFEARDFEGYLRCLAELHALLPEEDQIAEALIDALAEQRRTKEALELIEARGTPKDVEGLERYAAILLAEGRVDRATQAARELGQKEGIPFARSQRILRDILARMSEYVPALNILAEQADRMALRDQRLRWLEKSLDADARQPDVRRQMLEIYREMNQTVRLEALLEEAVAEAPGNVALLIEYIGVLHANDKVGDALGRLEEVNARPDAPARALLLEAQIRFDAKEWGAAAEAAERALAASPGEEDTKLANALIARVEKQVLTEEVAALVEQAAANPGDLELQLKALGKLAERGQADRVMASADRIMAHHPGARERVAAELKEYAKRPDVPFVILDLLTDLLAGGGSLDEALATVRQMTERSLDKLGTLQAGAQRILRRSPHHLPTLRALGDAYLANGRFTEMIHSYSLYLANGGEETEDIDRALAKAYISLNDYENARRFANQLLVANPKDIPLLKQMANLAVGADKADEAAEYLKKLELADPKDQELRKLKEKVNQTLGQRRFAYLQKEAEAGRGGAEILEQLGDTALEIGTYSDAITYFQRASREREDEFLAKRCKAKLALAYMKKRLDDLATETLREISLSLDDPPEQTAVLMDILYDVADLFLEYKLFAKAERVFKQLCKVDAGYRDVLKKVESLRAV